MSWVCLICGAALAPSTSGPDPTYCGMACRRASEYERRRVQRRLERLELMASNMRLWDSPQGQRERVEAEITRATGRLLELLNGQPGPDSPPLSGEA